MFANVAGAQELDEARARYALNNVVLQQGRISPVATGAGSSRFRVATDGTKTPDAPEMYFNSWGVNEENNVLVGLTMHGTFPPVNPVRFFVQNLRTRQEVMPQLQIEGSGLSPYNLTPRPVATIENIAVVLPGKVGKYKIEAEVDWNKDFYFGYQHIETIKPLGAIYWLCISGDTVTMTLIVDVFDRKFPNMPYVSVNAVPLASVEPPVVENRGFFHYVTYKVTRKDYDAIRADGEENGWLFVLSGNSTEVSVEWYDWLPPTEEIVGCVETSPITTKRRAVR